MKRQFANVVQRINFLIICLNWLYSICFILFCILYIIYLFCILFLCQFIIKTKQL